MTKEQREARRRAKLQERYIKMGQRRARMEQMQEKREAQRARAMQRRMEQEARAKDRRARLMARGESGMDPAKFAQRMAQLDAAEAARLARFNRQDDAYARRRQMADDRFNKFTSNMDRFMTDKYYPAMNAPRPNQRLSDPQLGAMMGQMGNEPVTRGTGGGMTNSQRMSRPAPAGPQQANNKPRMSGMKKGGKVKTKARGNGIAKRTKKCKMR